MQGDEGCREGGLGLAGGVRGGERWGRWVLGLMVSVGCSGVGGEWIEVERRGAELRLRTLDPGPGIVVLEESRDLATWEPVYAFPAAWEEGG